MKSPAAVPNPHLRRCSSLELLVFCLIIIFLIQSVGSTSSKKETVEWQMLTKHNFSSQVRLNPHILVIVTVPWSGECRSLMKELTHMVTKNKEEFRTLKLMFLHKNHDKMLADALGATMEINIICYRHSLPYKYQGILRVQSILSSVRYLMSLLPEELPLKSLQTVEDLTTFLKSTDKALLVLEFCGWTPKLMAKVMNNVSEIAFGVSPGTGLYGEHDEIHSVDEKKNQGMENKKITCDVNDQFSGLPVLGEFTPLNRSAFLEAEKVSSIDEASCSFEEFQLFESSLYNITSFVREFFLPPERLKFGLVSERSLISSLGVGDTGSWLMMLYSSGCPSCAKVFRGGSDLKRIIEMNASPAMELKGDENGFDIGLPADRPSVLLFIDRSSDSLKIRRKSMDSLTVLRELALPNHVPSKMTTQNIVGSHRTISRPPKLELSISSQKATALSDKITIMAMKEGDRITIDDVASNLQGSSLQEVLTYVLQQKKQRKLSSLAKDLGFQLLSDDLDITMSETEPQSIKGSIGSGNDFDKDQISHGNDIVNGEHDTLSKHTKVESSVEDDDLISVDTSAQFSVKTEDHYREEFVASFEYDNVEKGSIFNCSFFFVDGQYRLLEALTGTLKIPSLVIVDPLSHQHYVYPEEANFGYSSLSGYLQLFFNGSLLPYRRSKSVVFDSKETPRPPFVNQDFHEVDSIPRVSALTFMELVVGNRSGSYAENAWKKDVLVLFTSSWCGFCLRTELVVREIYRAFKGYGNMVKSQFRNEQSSSRNDGINNTNLKLPMIYTIDCVESDCSSLLKSSTKRDFYPSLLLYPAERKEAISYDRDISAFNIIKFIADQGGNSHWIYQEQGVLWSEPEHGVWNEKQFEVTSEPLTDEDVLLSKENNEILLKDRTQTQKLEIKSNQVKPNTPRDFSGSGHKILPGSILAATQKLQNVYPFSRSKILMVKVNESIGFEGVIINKLISWDSITELEEGLESLKEAPISYGGPVITRGMPLVSLTRQSFKNEHPEVLPDIYFLDQLATNNLMQHLKSHNRSMTDYWFFVGYSAWGWNQLFDEIADGSWNISDGAVEQFKWPMT
uniref:uncharacterized protein LOC122579027 n=1 Tax=Erigeron canadensis TaxID=72917 RepID=UPI001CB919BF|nr:uncharacterized protein LOC122579027 [Erigeron canadensis]